MTNIIFTVYSLEELYNKIIGLYLNINTAEELLHNMSYIDVLACRHQLASMINRYKKIKTFMRELINIEYYSKNNRMFLRINYKLYENGKWRKTNCYTADIWSIGYRSTPEYKDMDAETLLQQRNRFRLSNDEGFLIANDNNNIPHYYKDIIKSQINELEKMVDLFIE